MEQSSGGKNKKPQDKAKIKTISDLLKENGGGETEIELPQKNQGEKKQRFENIFSAQEKPDDEKMGTPAPTKEDAVRTRAQLDKQEAEASKAANELESALNETSEAGKPSFAKAPPSSKTSGGHGTAGKPSFAKATAGKQDARKPERPEEPQTISEVYGGKKDGESTQPPASQPTKPQASPPQPNQEKRVQETPQESAGPQNRPEPTLAPTPISHNNPNTTTKSGWQSDLKKQQGLNSEIGVSSQSERGLARRSLGEGGPTSPPASPNRGEKQSEPLQPVQPTHDKQESTSTHQEETGAEREAVERLREGAKLEEKPEKTPVRDPLYAAKVLEQEEGASASTYDTTKKPGVIPQEAPSAEAPEKEKGERDVKSLVRTYKDDVARALRKEQTSQVQMVLAEHRKKQAAEESGEKTSKRNTRLIALSTALIVLGLGIVGGGAWYFFLRDQGPSRTERIEAPTFIFVETTKALDITRNSSRGIVSAIQSELSTLDIRLDFVEHVFFTEEIPRSTQPTLEAPQTITTIVTAQKFFSMLGSRMPDSLNRALRDTFMYGIHSFNGNQPFLILKVRSYENAFAGFLEWEQYMGNELLPLFGLQDAGVELGARFSDLVRKNRDLRVLRDTSGTIVLLYTFYDTETIIITAAEETLDEVTTRLNRS